MDKKTNYPNDISTHILRCLNPIRYLSRLNGTVSTKVINGSQQVPAGKWSWKIFLLNGNYNGNYIADNINMCWYINGNYIADNINMCWYINGNYIADNINMCWYINGNYIADNINMCWYINGNYIADNINMCWYINGNYIADNINMCWYINGNYIADNINMCWYINGNYIADNINMCWYINGNYIADADLAALARIPDPTWHNQVSDMMTFIPSKTPKGWIFSSNSLGALLFKAPEGFGTISPQMRRNTSKENNTGNLYLTSSIENSFWQWFQSPQFLKASNPSKE